MVEYSEFPQQCPCFWWLSNGARFLGVQTFQRWFHTTEASLFYIRADWAVGPIVAGGSQLARSPKVSGGETLESLRPAMGYIRYEDSPT